MMFIFPVCNYILARRCDKYAPLVQIEEKCIEGKQDFGLVYAQNHDTSVVRPHVDQVPSLLFKRVGANQLQYVVCQEKYQRQRDANN